MVSALLTALLISSAAPDSTPRSGLAFTYSGVLQVDDAEAALIDLIAAADSTGGYFSRESRDRVELRIPSDKAPAFWKTLPQRGLLVEQNLESENLSASLADLDARIQAKRKVLDQYFALLQTAGDSSLSQVENAISFLQQEIDAATGERNLDADRIRFARMSVDFSFHNRTAPLPTGNTRFPWLNALSLQNLLDRFGHGNATQN